MKKMKCSNPHDTGVSEVVGEMLIIALVIVLLSVFSAALWNILPADRDPSVSLLMSNDRQNVTFWHKGGDWVRIADLTVTIGNDTTRTSFSGKSAGLLPVPDKDVFDLGSTITVRMPADLEGNETVRLVTPRTVLYTGRVSL